ncbi:MAG TPA: AzlD domain-containing protein [Burkholderiaceae bacterium]|nr:AzlD domain-containing protein [Burkholderiaceae bacterium]
MFDWAYMAAALATAAAITLMLRAAPFAIKNLIRRSSLLRDLNVWMPLGITTILAVYALSRIDLANTADVIAQGTGIVMTVMVHRWRHNIFLSLVSGTAVCVFLANVVLPRLT